jgi:putative endonuclease
MRLHMIGKGARYTRIHKPSKLVYTEEFGSRTEAMRRERRLKALRHDEKRRLARSHSVTVRHALLGKRH